MKVVIIVPKSIYITSLKKWWGVRDLNSYAEALDPKSSVSAIPPTPQMVRVMGLEPIRA